jgi:hypothetical protein
MSANDPSPAPDVAASAERPDQTPGVLVPPAVWQPASAGEALPDLPESAYAPDSRPLPEPAADRPEADVLSEALVQKAARAMCEADPASTPTTWDHLSDWRRAHYVADAGAALDAVADDLCAARVEAALAEVERLIAANAVACRYGHDECHEADRITIAARRADHAPTPNTTDGGAP